MPTPVAALPWTDRTTESTGSGPGARPSVQGDRAEVVVGHATASALCGLIFASVASGRPAAPRHAGEADGSPS